MLGYLSPTGIRTPNFNSDSLIIVPSYHPVTFDTPSIFQFTHGFLNSASALVKSMLARLQAAVSFEGWSTSLNFPISFSLTLLARTKNIFASEIAICNASTLISTPPLSVCCNLLCLPTISLPEPPQSASRHAREYRWQRPEFLRGYPSLAVPPGTRSYTASASSSSTPTPHVRVLPSRKASGIPT